MELTDRQAAKLAEMHSRVESARAALNARDTEEAKAFAVLLAHSFSAMRAQIEAGEQVGLFPHRIERAVRAVLGDS